MRRRPLRFERDAGGARLELDLPTAEPGEVEVQTRGEELWVSLRDTERCLTLPASWVGLSVAEARWRDGVLEVRFQPEPEP